MAKPKRGAAPTGGQWNFAGVLFQLLITLRTGLNAVVEEVSIGEEVAGVRIVVEPDFGGDAQTATGAIRLVDQIKIRRGLSPWTTRSIVEAVLPDLFKAQDGKETRSRYRFVTDNLAGTDAFAGFLRSCRALSSEGEGPDTLDAIAKSFRWGPARLSASGLFDQIVAVLAPANPSLVRRFLGDVEIVGVSQAKATAEVDEILRDLVDDAGQIPVRRRALSQALLELGAARNPIDGAALLRTIDLEPDRLSHPARLPALLRHGLERELVRQHYDRANDVRPEPSLPDSGFCVFSGDSGQGKTWRLCQAALATAEAGQCLVFLPATGSVTDIETEIGNRVWPANLGSAPRLARIAGLLAPKLAQGGAWLTLCLDDLADPALARALLRADWDDLGIRVLVTAQDRIANLLEHVDPGIAIQPVPDFTLPELRERLRRAGRDLALIPDDVLMSLTTPILAELYCRIPGSEAWTGVTEYELTHSYWRWATREHRDQPLHRSDAGSVLELAATLLDGPAVYPWPAPLLRRLNMPHDLPARLIGTGVLAEDEEGAISLSHSRLLNWVVAEEISRRFVEGECDLARLLALLASVDDLQTPRGDPIGRRLNYVMFDLFWMLSRRAPAATVGELARLYLRESSQHNHRHFFTAGLATLGAPVIPVLDWLSRREGDEAEEVYGRDLAAALSILAGEAEEQVSAVAQGLVTDDIGHSRAIGLRVLKTVPATAALDTLWALHRERRAALARADISGGDGQWHGAYRDSNQSYAALQRAARARPDWIAETAPTIDDPLDADQLIWLVNGLEWSAARAVWTRCKADLLAWTTPGHHGAPRVIRRLMDREEIPRVLAGLTETGVNAAVWFDALARLDPDAALDVLTQIDADALEGTAHWWMPGLAHRTGPRLGQALRQTVGTQPMRNDPILMRLGNLYSGETDLLDPETLDLLIDNYEVCLEADATGATTGTITRRHIRTLLASISSPALLERLAARAGGRFETLLTERAIANPGRISMTIDRDGTDYHGILAAIGGEGYDTLISAELDRPSVHGRTDGVTAALWTRSPFVRQKLEALALNPDDDTYRQVQLMQALASHHVDTGLAAMVRRGSPVFLGAVDVREGGPPMAPEAIAEIKGLLAHPDPAERLIGINLCGFLNAETGGPLLAPFLTSRAATEEETGLIVSIFTQTGYYSPTFLPRVRARLDREERGISAARYLAGHGDAEARAALVDWLEAHTLRSLNSSETPIVFHLLQFEDSRTGALRFLTRLWASSLGRAREGAILSVLAENGDLEARRDLERVANRSPRNGSGAIVTAIQSLSQDLPVEGQAAAERLFRRSHDLGAAVLLMRINPTEGLETLLEAYRTANVATRWGLGRVLRGAGQRTATLTRLSAMADSSDGADRQAAAELAGWMPADEAVSFLGGLADDPDPDVEGAALDALRRRTADAEAAILISSIPAQPRSRQWAWLNALIDLSDPSHLRTLGDPRAIHGLLETLGEDFAQEANRLLERRAKDLKSDADQKQKERDRR